MERVRYSCKKCGWKTSVLSQWADLKPKKCVGRPGGLPCGVNFLKDPTALQIELPASPQESKLEVKKEKKHVREERTKGTL